MKELELKDAPDVGGGNVAGPQGQCVPIDYPHWPLAPDPFGAPDPNPADPDAPPADPSGY